MNGSDKQMLIVLVWGREGDWELLSSCSFMPFGFRFLKLNCRCSPSLHSGMSWGGMAELPGYQRGWIFGPFGQIDLFVHPKPQPTPLLDVLVPRDVTTHCQKCVVGPLCSMTCPYRSVAGQGHSISSVVKHIISCSFFSLLCAAVISVKQVSLLFNVCLLQL